MKNVVSRWIFLRLLGFVYLIAFASLLGQVTGLIGPDGILPARLFLRAVHQQAGARAFFLVPTVFWLGAGRQALTSVCVIGAVGGALVMFDVAPAAFLLVDWALYLSLMSVGGDFLSFQWDALLVETGFLAVFLSSFGVRPRRPEAEPAAIVVWLFRLLLFRLMFFSGWVKLASGDLSWRHLTALQFHYETQPLPYWTSWFMHQMPGWWQRLSTLVVFVVELVVPFFLWAPRKWRTAGCVTLAAFQVLIMATGNFCFFNVLTIALCVASVDDDVWPARVRRWFVREEADVRPMARGWPRWVVRGLAALILPLSGLTLFAQTVRLGLPAPLAYLHAAVAPYGLVNNYGLFAVMTTTRPEIIVEGSNDGVTWRPYEFRYKPGDPTRRPQLVAPYQPRLDWQMWFAALSRYQDNPWFINFCVRLLQGSPDVLRLLKTNPFPASPPRYLRASLYQYHFSDWRTRRETGAWWVRERRELYLPPISLRDLQR